MRSAKLCVSFCLVFVGIWAIATPVIAQYRLHVNLIIYGGNHEC